MSTPERATDIDTSIASERIAFKVTPSNPDEVKPVYANRFLVQASDDEFFITATLAIPPPVADPDEMRKIQSLETPVVARIIVPPAVIPRLIAALQLTMKRFEISLPDSSDEDEA